MKIPKFLLKMQESVSVKTYAWLTGQSIKTVYHWIYLGKLKAFKDEGHWRVLVGHQNFTRRILPRKGV